jgi:hypothetical protein
MFTITAKAVNALFALVPIIKILRPLCTIITLALRVVLILSQTTSLTPNLATTASSPSTHAKEAAL